MTKTTFMLAALLLGSTTVAAQPKPGPAPAPSPSPQQAPVPGAKPGDIKTDEQKKAEAKALYDKGISHYNLGEFDPAIAAFRQAYAVSSAPGLLFNIAQSFRLKKDYENASYFYTTYLRLKPDAPNRADVEARIVEMGTLLEEQKKIGTRAPTGTVNPEGDKPTTTTTTTPTPTTTTPTTTTTTTPVVTGSLDNRDKPGSGDPHPGRPLKKAAIVTAGAGGALVLTGFVFGMMAKSAESDLNDLNSGGTWTPAQQDKYDAGKRNNTIAIVSFALGGAAVATGGVLWFLGTRKENEARVAVVPTKGGTSVAVGWSF